MANIFISHSTIDKGLADYLCNAFEERGLSCWIAPRDIVPGAEWAVSITNAIAQADVLFVLYSKNSIKSTQVTKEIGIADRKGKYILPYKIDDTEPEGAFDYYLTGCQWVVVDPASGDYKIDELCEILHGLIKERENKEAEEIKERANVEAEAIKELENIERSVAEAVVIPKTVQQPVLSDTVQRQKQPVASNYVQRQAVQPKPVQRRPIASQSVQRQPVPAKPRNNSAAKKERRNLLIGGGIALAFILFLVVGIAFVTIFVGRNRNEDSGNSNQGLTNIFDFTNADDFEYEILNGNITITGYVGEDTEVVIPEEIDGYAVKALAEKIFYCNTDITSVVIPKGVTEIPKFAFYKCTNLSSVTIPDSVVIIGEHSFEGCTSLSKVVLSDSVNIIDDFAFNNCTGMTELTLGEGITAIGNYAFTSCEALTEIKLPDTLNSIGTMAFAYCTEVSEITIPDEILTVSGSAFDGCLTISIYYKGNTYSYDISELVSELNGSDE